MDVVVVEVRAQPIARLLLTAAEVRSDDFQRKWGLNGTVSGQGVKAAGRGALRLVPRWQPSAPSQATSSSPWCHRRRCHAACDSTNPRLHHLQRSHQASSGKEQRERPLYVLFLGPKERVVGISQLNFPNICYLFSKISPFPSRVAPAQFRYLVQMANVLQ